LRLAEFSESLLGPRVLEVVGELAHLHAEYIVRGDDLGWEEGAKVAEVHIILHRAPVRVRAHVEAKVPMQ
jgi:hypothetical protein